MRCETSFFSLTLYKKYLTRYWPMWAVWLAGWMLSLPINLWRRAEWTNHAHLLSEAQTITDAIPVSGVIIALVAPLVAVAVFFHLFKGSAANFVGALPMRRFGSFATAFLAGFTMLVAPLAVTTLATLLVEWALGVLAPKAIFTWLWGCALQSFFWLSFATLCCVISGNAVASICFYGIFNGVVMGMTWLVQNVLMAFLYGFYQFGDGVWDTVAWLTPIFKITQNEQVLNTGATAVTRFEMLGIYAGIGFLMLLAAYGLYYIRKSERAGDLIAFGPIRWIFRISVTLCGGLSFGLLLMVILFNGSISLSGAYLAGCCALAAIVSWFVAEMLLQKSFKVFKGHWKGALVGALCFIVGICAIDMDWIGFTSRIPDPAQVRSATANFYGMADPITRDGVTYDGETVKDLIALHRYLADHRQGTDGNTYGSVELSYNLGLTNMRRTYRFFYDEGDELSALHDAAQKAGTPDFDLTRGTPSGGYFSYDAAEAERYAGGDIPATADGGDVYRDLTAREVEVIWAAVVEDMEAGRYQAQGNDYTYRGILEFNWNTRVNVTYSWDQFYIRPGTTSVNAAIEELGLMTHAVDQGVEVQTTPGGERSEVIAID